MYWISANAAAATCPAFPEDRVDFGRVIPHKTFLLERAFDRFQAQAGGQQRSAFDQFCTEQSAWLDDFGLFMALKEANGLRPWGEWDAALARREPAALLILIMASQWKILLSPNKSTPWHLLADWVASSP